MMNLNRPSVKAIKLGACELPIMGKNLELREKELHSQRAYRERMAIGVSSESAAIVCISWLSIDPS